MVFSAIIELLSSVLLMAGYVSGGEAFPKPLTSEEEEKYFRLYKNGDENARNILIEHNLRLVAHIAKKYAAEQDIDDMISIGAIGLIKAINTFDDKKNNRLGAYAARCIENEILMVLRSNKKLGNEVSIDESIGTDKEGNKLTFSDILAAETGDIADSLSDKIEMKKLYTALTTVLKKEEADILCWHYGLNNTKRKTQKEIAEILGISRSYVSRIEKKAIKKLAEVFAVDDEE